MPPITWAVALGFGITTDPPDPVPFTESHGTPIGLTFRAEVLYQVSPSTSIGLHAGVAMPTWSTSEIGNIASHFDDYRMLPVGIGPIWRSDHESYWHSVWIGYQALEVRRESKLIVRGELSSDETTSTWRHGAAIGLAIGIKAWASDQERVELFIDIEGGTEKYLGGGLGIAYRR
jgi:hypothetical protein